MVVHRREVVVAAPGGDDVVPVAREPLDEPGAEEASAARDEERGSREPVASWRAGRQPVDATDPAVAVLGVPADRAEDAFLPADPRLPAGLVRELLVADAERHHVARAGSLAPLDGDDAPVVGPEAVLDARCAMIRSAQSAIEMFAPCP